MLLGVDVGGTFTDAALLDGDRLHTAKVPSTPENQSRAVIAAVDRVLERAGAEPAAVEAFTHGMTVGTNALLEERGARTALVATRGFADLLDIGRQNRPSLYHPCRPKPRPLVDEELRFEVAERVGATGVIDALTDDELAGLIERIRGCDAESIAICLLFAFRDPSHEMRVAQALREALPSVHVSASHEVLPAFREYERFSTTVIDAYLSPLLGRYLTTLADACRSRGLPEPEVMRSSGGTAQAAEAARAGAWSVLSGPAGGAVGAALLASAAGDPDAIGIDMGGTSCEVCVVDAGEVRRTDARDIDGRPIQLPMVDVHTVGAGGGSIAWRDAGGALRVGPRSAGAEPGPACYGHGGAEPTVTDANLLLGYLSPESVLAGGVALQVDAARRAVAALGDELGLSEIETAEGIARVANQEMIRALRVVTVERGVDPRDYALLPFGGAGPMHSAALARELEISRIVCPRASGVLSALGLIAAGHRRDTARTVLLSGAEIDSGRIASEVASLSEPLLRGMEEAELEVVYELRYRGQAFELPIPGTAEPDPARLAEDFAREHEARYGYRDPEGELELVTIRVAAVEPGPEPSPRVAGDGKISEGEREARFDGAWLRTRVLRGEPGAGFETEGPCVFELPEATLVLPPGWAASVDEAGTIKARVLRGEADQRAREAKPVTRPVKRLDPVGLQVMTGALRAACDEMGAVLIRSAHSPNITERHDCSTALFDPEGELVMQAEHIPVHLGSMPDAVAAIVGEQHRDGDLWILNDPYRGGTHLPDITLISPIFVSAGSSASRPGPAASGSLIGFAASRAHHADIGGPTPGGMPALSVTLDEEGVVIPPTRADDRVLRGLAGRMRRPEQRLADLRAQRAANLTGIRRLRQLAERHGPDLLRTATAEILDYAERRTRAALSKMPDGESNAEDLLEGREGDVALRLRATVRGDSLELDFGGSAEQGAGNLNCPLSVTKAACFYAVRVVCDPDAPPSAGAWRPVTVKAPSGSLLNAVPPAAVVGGNVETSSRVADLVFAALASFGQVGADGQGTMNNVTLSGEDWTYYETIGGGQGACPGADGPSAEHVAMSNTLNTPIESLETDFPVLVRELSVRRGSGGHGRFRGGDGIVRELEATEPMRFTLIAERRRHAPAGREGGEPGAPGVDLLNGLPIAAKGEGELSAGDRLRIETPGGGGYGSEPDS
ncbi:MAG: hydantoinase B/oxoprolinase family protein [Solirubrobacterales bacterium]